MTELFDAHCHAQDAYYEGRSDEVARAALEHGVKLIAVGTDYEASRQAVELAGRHENVWAAVGLHPTRLFDSPPGAEVDEGPAEAFDVEKYRALLRQPKVVAVGEMGLDYHHQFPGISPAEMKARQLACFLEGARLAREEEVPIIIHSRHASSDQLALIKSIWGSYRAGEPLRGVAHCFEGRRFDAEQYIELGFCISFAGNLTYKPRRADIDAGWTPLPELAAALPLDRILVETDAPFLAPVPHRGETNYPHYVEHVARKLAEIRGLTYEEICATTSANARRLFRRLGA